MAKRVRLPPQVLFLHVGWAREYRGASDDLPVGTFGYMKKAQFYLAVDDPTGRLEKRIRNKHLTPSVWGWNDGSAEVRAA